MRHQVKLVATGIALTLLGIVIALMPGCQGSCQYEVRGMVRNASDGTSLAGVAVEVDAGILYKRNGLPATSATDGSFSFDFWASDGQFYGNHLPTWSATLSRDGYITEMVDISPRRRPDSKEPPSQIVLVIYLRPKSQ